MMQCVSIAICKTSKEISSPGIAFQPNHLQCEMAEAPNAKRACSSKLNNVSVGVRRSAGPRRMGCTLPFHSMTRLHRDIQPSKQKVGRPIFVARAESTLSDCTWSAVGNRQCKHIRYKSERKRGRGRSENLMRKIALQFRSSIIIGLKFVRNNFYYLHAIFH